jgi:hypothetical protein
MTMLLDAWAASLGQPAFITQAAADITGRRSRTFREWVTDHVDQFGTGSPLQGTNQLTAAARNGGLPKR